MAQEDSQKKSQSNEVDPFRMIKPSGIQEIKREITSCDIKREDIIGFITICEGIFYKIPDFIVESTYNLEQNDGFKSEGTIDDLKTKISSIDDNKIIELLLQFQEKKVIHQIYSISMFFRSYLPAVDYVNFTISAKSQDGSWNENSINSFKSVIDSINDRYAREMLRRSEIRNEKENYISEIRRIQINKVVLTTEDIKRTAEIIIERMLNLSPGNLRTTCIVSYVDASVFESQRLNILEESILLRPKQIKEINMNLSFDREGKDISLRLQINHGSNAFNSYFTVRSNNTIWMNSITKEIDDIIESWVKKPKYPILIKITSTIIVFYLLLKILSYVAKSIFAIKPVADNGIVTLNSLLILITTVTCILVIPVLTKHFSEMWPDVEIRMRNLSKTGYQFKRYIFLWLIASIAVPVIGNFLSDLIKVLF